MVAGDARCARSAVSAQRCSRAAAWLLAAVACVLAPPAAAQPAAPAPARTPEPGRTPVRATGNAQRQRLAATWDRITALLAQASAARAAVRVPPRPIQVRWQARRLASIPLDAPLLALAAADLDGDGRDELAALTARELVILAHDGHAFAVHGRALLPAEPATMRPRAPVGTLVVRDSDGDGRDEIAARSSEQARGIILALAPGAGRGSAALEERGRIAGFPLCGDVLGHLEPGRNVFDGAAPATAAPSAPAPAPAAGSPAGDAGLLPPLPPRFWSARCRVELVDPVGRPLAAAGVVGRDGTLLVTSRVRCAPAEPDCPPPAEARHAGAGAAFEIADLDRDGQVEIAVTRAAAPGDPDEVEVLTWAGNELRSRFRRGFTGGVVGLAAGDFQGRGAPSLIGAVRLLGSHRVDLWSFND
jgi:hypothetical protein